MRVRWIAVFMVLALASMTFARTEAPSAQNEPAVETMGEPVISHNASWASTLISTIAVMFLAAMIIGPLVRATAPREVPPAHSHDEPPGASGHHGHGGTKDLHPPEKHGH